MGTWIKPGLPCGVAVAEPTGKHTGSAGSPVAEDEDPEDDASADVDLEFEAETPTEANRANPLSAPGGEAENGTPPPEPFSGPGSYRMVRPAISDYVAGPVQVAGKADKSPVGRLIIGVARKPQ